MDKKALEAWVEKVTEEALKDTELEVVSVEYVREKDWYLRIYIDKPGGVEIDDCQFVSERLTELLDAEDPIKEKYYLEVSSPGIDRPLKTDKDYEMACGSKIDLHFYAERNGTKELVAVLESFDADKLYIKPIIKGRESRQAEALDRSLCSLVRLHIDF